MKVLNATTEIIRHLVARVVSLCVLLVETVAFWLAILLPASYPPVLVAIQEAVLSPMVFLGVVGLNALMLVLGHSHEPVRGMGDRVRCPGNEYP